jgi:hypothetical protein
MPSLRADGRVQLSGIEQVAIIISFFPRSEFERSEGRYKRRKPVAIREFEKKCGGEFVPSGGRIGIKFLVTNERRFNRQLTKRRTK